jgi:hypothetical protein
MEGTIFKDLSGKIIHTYCCQLLINQQVVPKELALLPSNFAAKMYGIPSSYENLCKVEIDGELYKAIAYIIDVAVLEYKLSSTP